MWATNITSVSPTKSKFLISNSRYFNELKIFCFLCVSAVKVSKMKIAFEIKDKTYRINTDEPHSIAIPLNFNGAQPNAYGVEKATSKPCETGELVGDTRRGGSCNFEQYKFIPHCNGTHTESIGHITHERISDSRIIKRRFYSGDARFRRAGKCDLKQTKLIPLN